MRRTTRRSEAELSALEEVWRQARALRDVWNGDRHFDVYFRAIKPLCDAVDAAERVLGAGGRVRRSPAQATPAASPRREGEAG
jgi:hypothetical protein